MSPVKSRREQYSEATRAALLEAATRRFAEHGFAGTSLEDVASDIQASRGAVYHHFANKTALFEAVFDALEVETIRRSMEAAEGVESPWDASQAALSAFLDVCCDPVYGRIVWQEAPIALGWERWQECEKKYALGLIEGIVKSLVDSGDLPDLPLEATARVTFHILGAAGLALAEADEVDKPRIRAEYGRTIGYLLNNARV